ncbi:hypothetical protein [Deinococcus cellulosilyticus]|uniref:Uncharacterized protein n=1 Tax=Deinococcus cellulosilyticus (strain DSM 18568 / NBRC 106333 / KACC 11606 / 5516J-15) TaxID=1223518 RepID=A0A511MYH1_DEIC1|nr:hypothetical protein [Deinococcus cellulosilyticus]GEM45328.1 hypothetical protein DC3_09630 [Deinococcus cellulosilyticus NBRC 106333 = KACC 11606]
MKSAFDILQALAVFHVPAEEHARDNLRAEMGIMAAFAPAQIPAWFDRLLDLSDPATHAAGPTSPFPAGHHMTPAVRLVEKGWTSEDAVLMALDNQEIEQPTEEDLLNLLGYSMALKVYKGDTSDVAMRQMDREMRWKAFYGTTLAMYVQQEFDRFPIQEKWMPPFLSGEDAGAVHFVEGVEVVPTATVTEEVATGNAVHVDPSGEEIDVVVLCPTCGCENNFGFDLQPNETTPYERLVDCQNVSCQKRFMIHFDEDSVEIPRLVDRPDPEGQMS